MRSFGRQVLPQLKLELQVYHCSMFVRQLMATMVFFETTISIAAIDEAVQRDWPFAGVSHRHVPRPAVELPLRPPH